MMLNMSTPQPNPSAAGLANTHRSIGLDSAQLFIYLSFIVKYHGS